MMLQWCAHSEHWATAQCSFKAIQKARMYAYSKKFRHLLSLCTEIANCPVHMRTQWRFVFTSINHIHSSFTSVHCTPLK